MSDQTVQITVSLPEEVAHQLAQFAKRSTFETFYSFTEGHLSHDERTILAYRMVSGIDAVSRALADAGYAPR